MFSGSVKHFKRPPKIFDVVLRKWQTGYVLSDASNAFWDSSFVAALPVRTQCSRVVSTSNVIRKASLMYVVLRRYYRVVVTDTSAESSVVVKTSFQECCWVVKCRNQCLDSPIEHAACRDDVSIGVWYVKKSTTWLSNISEIILAFLLTIVGAMTSQV